MLEGLVLGLHLMSQHSPNHENLNNANYGLYVRTEDGWVGGFYKNSWSRWSVHGGKYLWHNLGEGAEVGITLGLATGYKKKRVLVQCDQYNQIHGTDYGWGCIRTIGSSSSHIAPLVTVSVAYKGLRLSHAPKYKEKSAVTHLSIEHEF